MTANDRTLDACTAALPAPDLRGSTAGVGLADPRDAEIARLRAEVADLRGYLRNCEEVAGGEGLLAVRIDRLVDDLAAERDKAGAYGAALLHITAAVTSPGAELDAVQWVLTDAASRRELVAHVEALVAAHAKRVEPAEVASSGVALIAAERLRQIEREGWTPEHDDEHATGELAEAAACYARHAAIRIGGAWPDGAAPRDWPWGSAWWKPSDDPERMLVKAGALIAAEIDRLRRAMVRDIVATLSDAATAADRGGE